MSVLERERPNQFSFELSPELRHGLEELKDRDGAPVAVSIRRAIAIYLETKGIKLKAEGGKTRKRR
jgi:predicted DNA-binding protein